MDLSIEELQNLLREERIARRTAEQRAAASEQRAEVSEQRAEASEQRAEASEQQTQPTTLDEYLTECHQSVFTRLHIETDPNLRTRGSITNPQNKMCPTNLRPWPDFLRRQREIFGVLYDALPSDLARVFESRHFLAALGERIGKRHVADEKGLEYFLHNAVEDPVRNIIDHLVTDPRVAQMFDLGCGIIFENHPHALSELNEEVLEREAPSTPPKTPGQRENLNNLQADQICIYRSDDGRTGRTRAFVVEYKPPHKLTTPHLRVGLRSMNIHKEVVNRKTIPTSSDPEALFSYHAERLTASALTQTYHYTLEGGMKNSILTNGEAFVFLEIDRDDPETLYFHLAEPGPEVDAQLKAQTANAHLCTAAGQYLAFALMAISGVGDRLHSQDEREKAMRNLKTWAVDFESTYRSIPDGERSLHTLPDSSPGYQPTSYEEDRSPIRRRNPKRGNVGAESPPVPVRRDDRSDSSDEERAPIAPETPTPTGRVAGQGGRRSQRLALRTRASSGHGGQQRRQFCTQKCLLGLVRGCWLDESCPNVKSHRRQSDSQRSGRQYHPVTHTQWLSLLREQLRKSLDIGLSPLGYGGARGELFKVTLLAYGYTFVSKGTIRAFIPDLENEANVYRRFEPVQGVDFPVFLGAIDLRPLGRTYYFDHRVYIIHFTLLSWGGERIRYISNQEYPTKLRRQHLIHLLKVMQEYGVSHGDVREDNILFCKDINGMMMIDFERSKILEDPRTPLANIDQNKGALGRKAMRKGHKLSSSGMLAQDMLAAETMSGRREIGWNLKAELRSLSGQG